MWNDEACCVNINTHKYIIILPFISAAAVHGGVLCAGVLCACALVPYSRCVTAQSLHFTQAVYLKSLCLFSPSPSFSSARCSVPMWIHQSVSALCFFLPLCSDRLTLVFLTQPSLPHLPPHTPPSASASQKATEWESMAQRPAWQDNKNPQRSGEFFFPPSPFKLYHEMTASEARWARRAGAKNPTRVIPAAFLLLRGSSQPPWYPFPQETSAASLHKLRRALAPF